MPDLTTREGRLEAVYADLEYFRTEWEKLGSPLYVAGSKGGCVTHPLVRMLRAAELSAYRMERGSAPLGRPLGAQSAPDRVADRAAPDKRTRLTSVPT